MDLGAQLEAAAFAAQAHGVVAAVLAAEPASGERAYLVAFEGDGEREWLVLDESFGPVSERERVREVAAIVVLCELAVELAAGGRLAELRALLEEQGSPAAVREAAAELERVVGLPPRVASPELLDRLGEAAGALERSLGEGASPLASALASHSGAVEAFIAEVEIRNGVALR